MTIGMVGRKKLVAHQSTELNSQPAMTGPRLPCSCSHDDPNLCFTLSLDAVASWSRWLGCHVSWSTDCAWPLNSHVALPLLPPSTAQTRAVRSKLPDASRSPAQFQQVLWTFLLWPESTPTGLGARDMGRGGLGPSFQFSHSGISRFQFSNRGAPS